MPFISSILLRRTLGLMLAGVVALVVIVGMSVWLASRTSDHAKEVVRVREMRVLTSGLLTTLLEVETAQRGFLLTGAEQYLEPYEAMRPRVMDSLERLAAMAAGDPDTARSIERLRILIEAKLAELAETIEFSAAGNRDVSLDIMRSNHGKVLMDESRAILSDILDVSEVRVANRVADLNAAARTLTWITLTGGILVLLFATAASWIVVRHTRELMAARRDVETLNVSLEERVAERTLDLTRANDEIQRFAYIVSHDLRAPLVNIMGFTSELETGSVSLRSYLNGGDAALADAARQAANEDIPEAIRFIRASTVKMDGLINAILKLSREGRRELKPEPVDLAQLFAGAVAVIQHQLDEAGAKVVLPPRFPTLVSDRLALEQVFGNLLDNAVKYLSPDRPGLIEVRIEESRGRVIVALRDNGRGIAEQDQERIFELFRRAGAQDKPGEGVGLAHVRALVRRLGGDITVQSRLGEGTAFRVDLPRLLTLPKERTTA